MTTRVGVLTGLQPKLNISVVIIASSRLVFAVAHDGVLSFFQWVGQVAPDRQPWNAVTVVYIISAVALCTILPSQVAFMSLVSASAVLINAAYYGLIPSSFF